MIGPLAKPLPPPPEWLPGFVKSIEGQLITDQLKAQAYQDGFNQGTYTMYAAFDNMITWHLPELLPFEGRLAVAEKLINSILDKIEVPDEQQQFAEWLYEKQTGFKMERKVNLELKPYAKDLAQILKAKLAEKDMTQEAMRQKLSLSKVEFANIMQQGKPKKEAFDKIVAFLGVKFTEEQQKMYNECFTDRRGKQEKFAQMEKDLKTRNAEKAQEWLDKLFPGAECKVLSAEPVPIKVDVVEEAETTAKPSVAPVDEPKPVEPTVEQVEPVDEPKNEELPFSDCNEMYKEAEKEPSAVQILERKVAEAEAELIGCESLIKEKEAEIESLKTRQKQLDVAVTQINNSINIMKEAGL